MSDNFSKKVVIAMSGGVDSSVSAWLLQEQGYKVEGVFMKNWEEDNDHKSCSSAKDLADAQDVCNMLGIFLYTVNFSAEYWDNVFRIFLSEYQKGCTPNPDILCNKEIKFKTFLEFAIEDLCADFIATGHYVRRINIDHKIYLARAVDKNKDQSYFLYTLKYQQLQRCLFPLGDIIKNEVRNIAKKLKFITATKKDSTGICFIGKRKFRDFLARYLPIQPGKIVTVKREIIGYHQGLMYYTLGQRKGLKIGGIRNSNGKPWYVVDKDLINNLLIVVQGNDHPLLKSYGLIAKDLHWVNSNELQKTFRCTAKTRYQQQDISCSVQLFCDNKVQVIFDQPVIAVTPGQSIVFYLDELCIGGGIIETRMSYI
ncbi:tRNA 2-thiouridine(34) synthase MnmA [Blochmannia endosymbiont of Camponotus (Colobopsis) obliquus]|uniref:tRNA 2-thiouridine(34) synthase MnmA n=1 Tax=Blochmannia endosymbiont of Camponotus (Colobopsis) obliquus TaxID=1505597 RepID=UPI00061A6E70|nr:tRNA 2-thiouridine(34) synthase MnmA [Blochmannia endosymbiont of Camponotus (Colobopsis) obliquus]AKC60552.1 tRNA-specific 2-thiouridylase MnmA [Blochmannia endosymbiont of Camponotus (Colobopsis) obliquus]